MCLSLKFLEESGGEALTSNGGRLSLGPPSGGIIFAQPGPLITLMRQIKMSREKDIIDNFFMKLQT
jgi:hypothetical protein